MRLREAAGQGFQHMSINNVRRLRRRVDWLGIMEFTTKFHS
jgi:hypothetical protein